MLRTISPSKSSDSKGTRCSVLKGTGAPSGWPSRRCCCGPGAGGAAGGRGAASVPGRGRGLWGGMDLWSSVSPPDRSTLPPFLLEIRSKPPEPHVDRKLRPLARRGQAQRAERGGSVGGGRGRGGCGRGGRGRRCCCGDGRWPRRRRIRIGIRCLVSPSSEHAAWAWLAPAGVDQQKGVAARSAAEVSCPSPSLLLAPWLPGPCKKSWNGRDGIAAQMSDSIEHASNAESEARRRLMPADACFVFGTASRFWMIW